MEKAVEDTLHLFRLSEPTKELRRVYVQGLLWQLIVRHEKHNIPRSKKGRQIMEFSYQARMRMLKFVATVNYDGLRKSLFMTFTYPDECLPRAKDQTNKDRYLIWRVIEKVMGRKVCGIWRKEWQVRKSGKFQGQRQPHFHFLLFDVGYTPYKKIRLAWRRIIKAKKEPSMKFVPCGNSAKVAGYVSKYVAKVEPSSNLDNVVHLNSPGRHYGFFRKG
jgi:hypothetical protein